HSMWNDDETPPNLSSTFSQRDKEEFLKTQASNLSQIGIPTTVLLSSDRPALDITHRASHGEVDFVIVGRRRESPYFGSVSRKLLRKCPCPLWVTKEGIQSPKSCILAATDMTSIGTKILEIACKFAIAGGASLHVLHAWQRSTELQLLHAQDSPQAIREENKIQSEIETAILDTVAMVSTNITPILHVGCDSPSRSILDGVRALEPDLLILGSVSRSGVPGLLLGNTAERVLDKVSCSVLTIKPDGWRWL
ncbi:MAG: universal stress protein, partial [Bdellovibrionales bacterium]|nr:universal stress protein [Bdellovibrionales bacterium]